MPGNKDTPPDNLAYLLEHGMPLEDVEKYLTDGITMKELTTAAERLIKAGQPLAVPEELPPAVPRLAET